MHRGYGKKKKIDADNEIALAEFNALNEEISHAKVSCNESHCSKEHKSPDPVEQAPISLLNAINVVQDLQLVGAIPQIQDGEFFEIHEKRLLLDKRSLYIFDHTFKIRKAFVWFAEWKWFERFIIFCILVNSILLAIGDFKTRLSNDDYVSNREAELNLIDNILTGIFIMEFVSKVISRGLVIHRNSYLKDPWNWLDCFVVIVSILGLFQLGNKGLRALRTFRILRPLKTINAVPRIRSQIQVLIWSIPGLVNTLLFLTFIFSIFGILGSQSFAGGQYKYCRMTPEPEIVRGADNEIISYSWPIVDTFTNLCRDDKSCELLISQNGPADLTVFKCGESIEYGVSASAPTFYDESDKNESIFMDIVNFNNVGAAMVCIFMTITLEGWTQLMYNNMESQSYITSIFFFVTLILVGSFFMLNLVLGTIIESFYETKKKQDYDVFMQSVQKQEVADQKIHKSLSAYYLQRSGTPRLSNKIAPDTDNDQNYQTGGRIVKTNVQQQPKSFNVQSSNGSSSSEEAPSDNKLIGEGIQNKNHQKDETLRDSALKMKANSQTSQKFTARNSHRTVDDAKADQVDMEGIKSEIDEPLASDDPNNDVKVFQQRVCCTWERLDAEERSKVNIMFMITYRFVCHWAFQFTIFLLIIANTIALASFSYPMSENKERILFNLNLFFTWAFTAELLIKLVAFGPNNYRKDYFNLFDALLVILSLVDWGLEMSKNHEGQAHNGQEESGGVLSVFKALRLLRVIKVARSWKGLQTIIKKTARSALDILTFAVLLLLFVFIFALLGMEFFAYRVRLDQNTGEIVPYSELPERFASNPGSLIPIRTNFDSIGRAMTTVFAVITLEDWQWRLFNHIEPFPRSYSIWIILGFIVCICIGCFTLLALFTAILLQNFEATEDSEDEMDDLNKTINAAGGSPDKSPLARRRTKLKMMTQNKQKHKTKFFSMATWNAFRFTFIKIFDLRQPQPPSNQIANSASPSSGVKALFSSENSNKEMPVPRIDIFASSKLEDEIVHDEIFGDKSGETSKPRSYPVPVEMPKEISSKLSRQDSNTIIEVESFTIILPHLKYKADELVRRSSSKIELNLYTSASTFNDIKGKSLFLFEPDNRFRLAVAKLVKQKAFDYFILSLIAISTIMLSIDSPLRDPESTFIQIIEKIDYGFTAIFTIEAILKIIAYGFMIPQVGYIRNPWNILDFTVVFFSIMAIVLAGLPILSVVKIIRVARVLRPLRVVSKNKGLQIAITCLAKSIPGIVNLQLIVFFVITMMAILHTFIFAGKMGSCDGGKLQWTQQQINGLITDKQDCINYGGEWVINDFNFNSFGRSFLTLFTIQTLENWIEVMWSQVDAVGPDMAPITDYAPAMPILSIAVNMILSLLFLNLFVGVVVETFNIEKERISQNLMLEDMQRQWLDVQLMAYGTKPEKELEPTKYMCRRGLRKLVKHVVFEYFIMGCILGNTIVLCISWYGISDQTTHVTEILNYVFMSIFAVEALLKIVALDKHYFSDSWNNFDFIVVCLTLVVLILENSGITGIGKQASILRSLRILRVLRIFKNLKRLQIIFRTLTEAAPSMGSLGLLMLLLIFIYAILGMQLFGYIKIENQSVMDAYHVNFHTFLNSFLLLIRCTTGEAWNQIMFDCARSNSITFQCDDSFDYKNYSETGQTNNCGSPAAAYIYFISFVLIVTQVFLNIFIAIAVDSFLVQAEKAMLPVSEGDMDQFAQAWKKYDPKGTGYMMLEDLELLIIDICKDDLCDLIYLKKPMILRAKVRAIMISKLQIPTYNRFESVYFYDVLLCLCKEKLENEFDRIRGVDHKEKIKYLLEMKKNFEELADQDQNSKDMLTKTNQLIQDEIRKQKVSAESGISHYHETLLGLRFMSNKIERVKQLQKGAKKNHQNQTTKKDIDVFHEKEQFYFYTTSHFVYGSILKINLINFVRAKKAAKIEAEALEAEEHNNIDRVMVTIRSEGTVQKADEENGNQFFNSRQQKIDDEINRSTYQAKIDEQDNTQVQIASHEIQTIENNQHHVLSAIKEVNLPTLVEDTQNKDYDTARKQGYVTSTKHEFETQKQGMQFNVDSIRNHSSEPAVKKESIK